jgi:hypothetical protein
LAGSGSVFVFDGFMVVLSVFVFDETMSAFPAVSGLTVLFFVMIRVKVNWRQASPISVRNALHESGAGRSTSNAGLGAGFEVPIFVFTLWLAGAGQPSLGRGSGIEKVFISFHFFRVVAAQDRKSLSLASTRSDEWRRSVASVVSGK